MPRPRRLLIYCLLLIIIFSLQAGGFFSPSSFPGSLPGDSGFAKAKTASLGLSAEEVSKEKFTGQGGPHEPPLLKLNLFPYKVQPGDNLWTIAKRRNLDLDTLISANKLQRANLINAGDILHIPNRKGVFHKIRKGETLSEIANAYKCSIEEILKINAIENPEKIGVNKQIFIPGAKLLPEQREYILGFGFIKPCRGWISSGYGWRRDPFTKKRRFHRGVDIAGYKGTPIYAARGGRVTYSGWSGGYGRLIIIQHSQGYSTRYGHNSANLVKKGRRVRQGQLIARVGNTGRSTGPHLHFEIRRWGRTLNPLPLIRRCARK